MAETSNGKENKISQHFQGPPTPPPPPPAGSGSADTEDGEHVEVNKGREKRSSTTKNEGSNTQHGVNKKDVQQQQIESKQTTTATAPKKEQAKPKKQKKVTIRTMRDDLESAKKQGAQSQARQPQAAPQQQTGTPTATDSAAPSAQPEDTSNNIQEPVKPRKKKKSTAVKVSIWLGGIVLVLAIGGGVAWFMYEGDFGELSMDLGGSEQTSQTVQAAEVIPSDTALIVEYNIESVDERENIMAMWGNNPPTLTGALEGDPRKILQDGSVSRMFYVVLPDDPRPYTIVESTEQIKELLAEQSVGQFIERDGWVIAHSLNPDAYTTALATGTRADTGGLPNTETAYTGRMMLSPFYANQITASFSGEELAYEHNDDLLLYLSYSAQNGVVSFTNGRPMPAHNSQKQDTQVQNLLTAVPGDATHIISGYNFTNDLSNWQAVTSRLNQAALDQPVAQELVTQLQTPYAVYTRDGQDGVEDIGLAVRIPDTLNGQLEVGDAGVEKALKAIVPLIIGSDNGASLAFSDAEYSNVQLRYINLNSQTQALDYAINESLLLIATSKEGMAALIETVQGDTQSAIMQPLWSGMVRALGNLAQVDTIALGELNAPSLIGFLPTPQQNTDSIPLGVSVASSSAGRRLQGALVIQSPQPTTEPPSDQSQDPEQPAAQGESELTPSPTPTPIPTQEGSEQTTEPITF